jgi:hypothetical protein
MLEIGGETNVHIGAKNTNRAGENPCYRKPNYNVGPQAESDKWPRNLKLSVKKDGIYRREGRAYLLRLQAAGSWIDIDGARQADPYDDERGN